VAEVSEPGEQPGPLEGAGGLAFKTRRLVPALALLAVAALSAWAAWKPLGNEIRLGFRGDWRAACAGFQRWARTDRLLARNDALVHFHELDGRAGALRLELSAVPGEADLRLMIRRDREPVHETRVTSVPTIVTIDVPEGTRDLDVELAPSPPDDAQPPFLLDAVSLTRAPSALTRLRRLLPLVAGLAVLVVSWRRLGAPLATGCALLATGFVAFGLLVAFDPTALYGWRPGIRSRAHVTGLALLALAIVAASFRSRTAAIIGVALMPFALHLPALHFGLHYDDFLWARPWSLSEVASTFAGSEDPLGVSSTHYRPLPSVSHALDYLVWGFSPEGYRVTNLSLLALNGLLAFGLLVRLGLPQPAGALAGMVLVAHPLSASAVGWISERTDALVLGFCVIGLIALAGRWGTRPLAVLPFALGACWSKENGVVLALLGALVVWAARPPGGLRARVRTLAAMLVLAAGYVAVWLSLFPEKAAARAGQPMEFRNFDPANLVNWLRLVPGLYGPMLLPTDWRTWRDTPLHSEPIVYSLAASLLAPALLLLLARCPSCRGVPARLVLVGLLWAPILLLPTLGLRRVDVYRLGLVPAFGAALIAAAAAAHLAHRSHGRAALPWLAAALLVGLAPPSRESLRGWGPGGFYYEAVLRFNREMPEWLAVLRPEARARFDLQAREADHREFAESLTEGGQ